MVGGADVVAGGVDAGVATVLGNANVDKVVEDVVVCCDSTTEVGSVDADSGVVPIHQFQKFRSSRCGGRCRCGGRWCRRRAATVLGGANVDKVVADVVVGCVASVMGSSCKCGVWCSRSRRCRWPVV